MCTSVEYNPPAGAPWSETIRGRAAFRRHTEEVFRSFPDAKFELLQILWLPLKVFAQSGYGIEADIRASEKAGLGLELTRRF